MQQVAIENRISEIEATLIEFETDSDYKNRLLEEDWREYQSMLFGVKEGSIYYCDYVRERIKEKLGDPVSLNALSLDNRVELTKMLDGVNSYAEKLRINEEV